MDADAKAASQWVLQQPPSHTRDAAIAAMVQTPAAQKNLENAANWAASIQDSPLREQVSSQVIQQWQTQNPRAAQQWLSNHR